MDKKMDEAKAALAAKREELARLEEYRRDVPPGIEETGRPIGIRAKIAAVQQAVGAISKDAVNKHFGNRYATLKEVWQSVKGELAKERLAVYCTTDILDGTWILTTHVANLDNAEVISARFPIQATGTPQQMGSAITYARRYTLCALLQIVTADDEDDDGNAAEAASGKGEGKQPW